MRGKITLIAVALLQINFATPDPLVEIPNGQILGRENATAAENTYFSFKGIPFGAPPTGKLRFQAPEPAEPWEGVLNATESDIVCIQFGNLPGPQGTQSEDCLVLNVFTPKLPTVSKDVGLLPVMAYIYGGGFTEGSTFTDYPDLFIDNDVVFVSMNYRVGILGFISTQDDIIPGNAALKDQALALQWIHDNIKFFGGDPEKVTIFGQSAGAGSVAYQLLNQKNLGIIAGAIIESGSSLSTGMFQRWSKEIAFGVGAVLNSTFETSEDSEALLELLQNAGVEELVEAVSKYRETYVKPWSTITEPGQMFAPVIEAKNPDALLTKKQYGLLKAGNALPVPVMMGYTSEEKIKSAQDEDQFMEILQAFDENLAIVVPSDVLIADQDELTEFGSKIRDIYTGGEPFVDHIGAGVRYASDMFITRSMRKHAELASQFVDIYFYQFSFAGELDEMSVHYDDADFVGHTAELSYLFCSGADCKNSSEADLLTRRRVIKLWTNFAKYQNPIPEESELLQNVTWPKVSTENGDFVYLDIGENLEVKNHPKEETYRKWVELYDSLDYDDFDTY